MADWQLSDTSRKDWEIYRNFGLIFALGIFLRFYRLTEPQLWLDELLQLIHFSLPGIWDNLSNLTRQVAATPLDYLVQSVFVRLFGPWELGSRIHAALFGSLSLPLFFAIVRRILGLREALVATLFIAVYPLHVFYSREGRNYSLFVFLSLLSLLLLLNALRDQTRSRWLWFGGASVLLLYTNYLAVLIVSFETVVVLALSTFSKLGRDIGIRATRRELLWFCVSAGGALFAFLPWLILTISGTRADFSEDFFQFRFWLRVWRELSGGSAPLSLLLTILIVLGVRRLLRERRSGALLLLGSWFLVSFLGVLFVDWYRNYFFAIRQVLVGSPALLVLAAAGVRDGSLVRGSPALVLALFLVLGIGTHVASDRKNEADWKGLVEYLERTDPRDFISAPKIEQIVSFRFPDFGKRRVTLEDLVGLETGTASGLTRKVHLVLYRSVAPALKADSSVVLAQAKHTKEVRLRGFEIHVLFP